MKIIKAVEISEKIISLIDEADQELVLVSSFSLCRYGQKLFATLQRATYRGVKISFYLKNEIELCAGIKELDVDIYFVENPGTNICFNEKQAILFSASLNDDCNKPSADFGIITENLQERNDIKTTSFSEVEKNVCSHFNGLKQILRRERAQKQCAIIEPKDEAFETILPKRMKSFEAHFQKNFHRNKLVYNEEEDTISYKNFPFEWTSLEYSGNIKISLLLGSSFDYAMFRHENIDEFSDRFRNHKTYWSYPYDNIRMYGNEAANGINSNDINSQINYMSWLIKEVTTFLRSKEQVVLKTPLYRFHNRQL